MKKQPKTPPPALDLIADKVLAYKPKAKSKPAKKRARPGGQGEDRRRSVMPIENLTHAEVGAFLMAVGHVMQQDDVCAGAACDGSSDDQLVKLMFEHGDIEEERAKQLCELDPETAVAFCTVG